MRHTKLHNCYKFVPTSGPLVWKKQEKIFFRLFSSRSHDQKFDVDGRCATQNCRTATNSSLLTRSGSSAGRLGHSHSSDEMIKLHKWESLGVPETLIQLHLTPPNDKFWVIQCGYDVKYNKNCKFLCLFVTYLHHRMMLLYGGACHVFLIQTENLQTKWD